MAYIFELMSWCGFVHVANPTNDQLKEAKELNEIEYEEDILEIIQSPDFYKKYPNLAGIQMV